MTDHSPIGQERQPHTGDPDTEGSWREALSIDARQEWGRRTSYGRLWYPVWFVSAVLARIVTVLAWVIIVFTFAMLLEPGKPIRVLCSPILRVGRWVRRQTPAVYREGGDG